MFRCNDEHGLVTRSVDEIDIADEIHIVCAKARPPTFRVQPTGRFNVGRYHYEHHGEALYVGNIFWNALAMNVREARRMIRNLLADGWAVEEWAEEGPFAHLARKP